MGLVDTEAIVLRTYKLAEADKIAVCLTRASGLIRGVAHGARRLKSRFGASLEPFTLISLSYFEKEGRELVTLSRAEILRSYFSLARQPEAIAILEYMSELAMEFAPPHQPDEKLFRMARACVEALTDLEAAHLPAIALYYEIWMLKLAGFLPDLRTCSNCRRKLPNEGEVYLTNDGALRCAACADGAGIPLSAKVQFQLRMTQVSAPSRWADVHALAESETHEELARLTRRLIEKALERKPRGHANYLMHAPRARTDY